MKCNNNVILPFIIFVASVTGRLADMYMFVEVVIKYGEFDYLVCLEFSF